MKINKNIIAFTMGLMFCNGIFANECDDNETRLTDQQESILSEVASTVTESVINVIEHVIESHHEKHVVSLEDAHILLQDLMDNLIEGSKFEINDIKYIVNSNKDIETVLEDEIS